MATKPTTEIATVAPAGELLAPPAAADDALLASMAGEGNENVTHADVAIPRLVLLQSLSPQIKRTEPEWVEGAQDGDYFNTLTKEVYGPEVEIINCHFLPVEAEWVPRKMGGGFRGSYPVNDPIKYQAKEDPEQRGRMVLPNGNDLVHTDQHFVLVRSKVTGRWEQALLAMVKTQLKHSRRMNALLGNQVLSDAYGAPLKNARGEVLMAPRFASVIRLTTVSERNEQGSWFGVNPTIERRVTPDELALAKSFRDSIAKGDVKVNLGEDADEAGAGSAARGGGSGPTIDGSAQRPAEDDEIPF